jgi:hypothetical protein
LSLADLLEKIANVIDVIMAPLNAILDPVIKSISDSLMTPIEVELAKLFPTIGISFPTLSFEFPEVTVPINDFCSLLTPNILAFNPGNLAISFTEFKANVNTICPEVVVPPPKLPGTPSKEYTTALTRYALIGDTLYSCKPSAECVAIRTTIADFFVATTNDVNIDRIFIRSGVNWFWRSATTTQLVASMTGFTSLTMRKILTSTNAVYFHVGVLYGCPTSSPCRQIRDTIQDFTLTASGTQDRVTIQLSGIWYFKDLTAAMIQASTGIITGKFN